MADKLYWYNFKTSEYEYIECPESFEDYISQDEAAQALYRLYVKMGKSPISAAKAVLTAMVASSDKKDFA